MPENPKSKPVNPWVCVADGIYKNTVFGIYYERPWVGGRRTFRSLRTDSLKLAREVYHHRRTKVVEASIGKADDPYARQKLLTTGQVIPWSTGCATRRGVPPK